MFKHQGQSRTFKHNLRIATVLSFVAGIINVSGFLAFQKFTTNVTGHFAILIYDFSNLEFAQGLVYLFYIFSFLAGSFTSSVLLEVFRNNKKLNVFVLPTLIESIIIIAIAYLSTNILAVHIDIIACSLLFAMGLQNSYVTKISNAVVRTTHLTGLFTDLGIDLSHLLFTHMFHYKEKIKANVKLRIYIITFFFGGGLLGGFLFSKVKLGLGTLYFAALILIINLLFDDLKFRLKYARRKYKNRKSKILRYI